MFLNAIQSTARQLSIVSHRIAFPTDTVGKVANLALLGFGIVQCVARPLATRLFSKQEKIDPIKFHSLIIEGCKGKKDYFEQAKELIKNSYDQNYWFKLAVNYNIMYYDLEGLKRYIGAAPTPELRLFLSKQLNVPEIAVQAQIEIAMNMIQPERSWLGPFGLTNRPPSQESLKKAAKALINAKSESTRINKLEEALMILHGVKDRNFESYLNCLRSYQREIELKIYEYENKSLATSHISTTFPEKLAFLRKNNKAIGEYLENVKKASKEEKVNVPAPQLNSFILGMNPQQAHAVENQWLEKAEEIIGDIKDEETQDVLKIQIFKDKCLNNEKNVSYDFGRFCSSSLKTYTFMNELLNVAIDTFTFNGYFFYKFAVLFSDSEEIEAFIQPKDSKGNLDIRQAESNLQLLQKALSFASQKNILDQTSSKEFISAVSTALVSKLDSEMPQAAILNAVCHFGKLIKDERIQESLYIKAHSIRAAAKGQPAEFNYCMTIANAFAKSKFSINVFHQGALDLAKALPNPQPQSSALVSSKIDLLRSLKKRYGLSKFDTLTVLYGDFCKNGDKLSAQEALEAMENIEYSPNMWKEQFYNLCELAKINHGAIRSKPWQAKIAHQKPKYPATTQEQKEKNKALMEKVTTLLTTHSDATKSNLYLYLAKTYDTIEMNDSTATYLNLAITHARNEKDLRQILRRDISLFMKTNLFDRLYAELKMEISLLSSPQKIDTLLDLLETLQTVSGDELKAVKSKCIIALAKLILQIQNPNKLNRYMIFFLDLIIDEEWDFTQFLLEYLNTLSDNQMYMLLKAISCTPERLNQIIDQLLQKDSKLDNTVAIKLLKIDLSSANRSELIKEATNTLISSRIGNGELNFAQLLLKRCLDYGHLEHAVSLRTVIQKYNKLVENMNLIVHTLSVSIIWSVARLLGSYLHTRIRWP